MPREEIFRKFKAGTLRSGSGKKVTDRKQATAIAMSYQPASKGGGKTRKSGRFGGRRGVRR